MDALNGKKTYIGGLLLAIGAVVSAAGYPEIGELVTQLGQAVSVAGIGHKLAKAATP